MSGGRFLVSLREVYNSEKIISIQSLLKVGVNIWEEDLKDDTVDSDLNSLAYKCFPGRSGYYVPVS